MLEIPCAVCQKRTPLPHLRTWRSTYPICSDDCSTADGAPSSDPPDATHCARSAIAALEACKPVLDGAIGHAGVAACNEIDKDHLNSEAVGLGVIMTGVVGATIVNNKLNTAECGHRDASYGVLMALEELQRQLLPFVCNMMGLHALGHQVAGDLQPLVTHFTIFKVKQPELLPMPHVRGELLQLHDLLSSVHSKLTSLLWTGSVEPVTPR